MWQLHPNEASVCLPRMSAKVCPQRPWQGVREIRYGRRDVPATVLRIQLPGECVERAPKELYIRGSDLIATYPDLEPGRVRCQIYWRCVSLPEWRAEGFDLILSVQTDLLDSHPDLTVTSQHHHATGWKSRAFATVAMPGEASKPSADAPPACFVTWDDGITYVEMIHPRGDGRLVIAPQSETRESQWQLFGGPLEKGVLRRSCLRGLFLPTEDADAAAEAIYRDLIASPLPLTT